MSVGPTSQAGLFTHGPLCRPPCIDYADNKDEDVDGTAWEDPRTHGGWRLRGWAHPQLCSREPGARGHKASRCTRNDLPWGPRVPRAPSRNRSCPHASCQGRISPGSPAPWPQGSSCPPVLRVGWLTFPSAGMARPWPSSVPSPEAPHTHPGRCRVRNPVPIGPRARPHPRRDTPTHAQPTTSPSTRRGNRCSLTVSRFLKNPVAPAQELPPATASP